MKNPGSMAEFAPRSNFRFAHELGRLSRAEF
jgi:hypothetical protein